MDNIDTIIQGGAVGIAVALILVIVYIIKLFMKHLGNHAQHQTNAINENTKATSNLEKTIAELAVWIRRSNGKH